MSIPTEFLISAKRNAPGSKLHGVVVEKKIVNAYDGNPGFGKDYGGKISYCKYLSLWIIIIYIIV